MSSEDKSKQSARSNVIYPGVSKQFRFQIETEIQEEKNCDNIIGIDISDKRKRNLGRNAIEKNVEEKDRSFQLDWIDYKSSGPSNLSPVTDIRGHSLTRFPNQKQRVKEVSIMEGRTEEDLARVSLDSSNLELMQDNSDAAQLDGDLAAEGMSQSGSYPSLEQLEEPILATLWRDLTGIYLKTRIVALPLSSYDIYKVLLRGWDLWGPLLLCTWLAFNLHQSDMRNGRQGIHFADVFVLVWFGSCLVSLNFRLLSASGDPLPAPIKAPSLLQLMCVLGYCLVAPCFALLLIRILSIAGLLLERVLVGLLFGFLWPTGCSLRVLLKYQRPEKRALAVYPIALFYLVLSCLIIMNQ